MNAKLFFLEPNDPETAKAFSNFTDPIMRNSEYGEYLQYMGTVVYSDGLFNKAHHEFRHRAVPGTNKRQYWKFPVSNELMKRINAGEFKLF